VGTEVHAAEDLAYGEELGILVQLVATGRLYPEIGRVINRSL
jgi:hypothetical protein